MFIDKDEIINIFSNFEKEKITYAILRDVDKELPDHYSSNKDIDIIVYPECHDQFVKYMHLNKWKRVEHPLGEENTIFLYAMNPFEFYIKNGIRLDVCYQLSCKSTNAGEWMPIDRSINKIIWTRLKKNEQYSWFELSDEDELIHLITRCIFDKKKFNEAYKKQIDILLNKTNIEVVTEELKKIFYSFTSKLLILLSNKEYDCIIEEYLTFKEY